jgi:tetratricopeptide (TPR) repeat protein
MNYEEAFMEIRNTILRSLLVFLFLAFLLSIPQMNFGQDSIVRGVVTDQEGKSLKNAKITFLDPSRGLKFNLKSGKKGKFVKVGVPPSFYRVTVQLEGYFPFESQIRIRLGMTDNIEIKLEKIPPQINKDKDLSEGIDFYNERKYDEAIASFEKVIEKFPSNTEGYYNLGLAYMRKGDVDRAIECLEKAVELKSAGIEPYLALGESYFKKGDSEKAEDNFKLAIEFQPENPKAHYNLGIVFYKLDKTEDALNAFDKAIELNPELSSACYQAGLASVKMGNYKKAIKYFEEFLRLEPDAPETSRIKAMIEELKKHQTCSIMIPTTDGETYPIRKPSKMEEKHYKIYRKLEVITGK